MQFRDHPGVQGKRDAYPFDPRLLKIDTAYNVRDLDAADERADLDELKESIRANGVRVPLEVRLVEEEVFVIAGHRRHKAVMELIAEGEPIKAVPVMPEPKNTTPEDRIVNLVISNSGKPLKPLEVAEVVRRLEVYGWNHVQIAKRLGWKSTASVTKHLDLIKMPEPVKEHVREGDISASEAAKLVKGLAKGVDPIEAAKMIKANKEENKRLGVGAKSNHKVTAKTLQRDKPKAPAAPKEENAAPVIRIPAETATINLRDLHDEIQGAPAASHIPLSDETPPAPSMAQVTEQIERIVTHEPAAASPPPRSFDINQKFFAIVCRLATIGEGFDLNALADDHPIEIPAEVIKAADRSYREHIGDV
jgi:ParB/RepB/Spo0J family partition protein